MGRRYFLRAGSLGLLGIGLRQFFELESQLAAAEVSEARKKAKAKACILLWLEGGPSQYDTWDPKPGSAFKPIPTNVAGIQISELLPRVPSTWTSWALSVPCTPRKPTIRRQFTTL